MGAAASCRPGTARPAGCRRPRPAAPPIDRLAAHEVRMRDRGPRVADRMPQGDVFVGVEQRVHGPVAHGMGRELQTGFDGRFDDRHQSLLRDESHAAILRIADRIDLAHAPGIAHQGAAGEHAAVEKGFDAHDPELVIAFDQRIGAHLANRILHGLDLPVGFDQPRNGHPHGQVTHLGQMPITVDRRAAGGLVAHGGQTDRVIVLEQCLQPTRAAPPPLGLTSRSTRF